MKNNFVLALVALLLSAQAYAEKTDLELVSQQGVAHFFTLSKPWIVDKVYVEGVARSFCKDKTVCRTHFWEKGKAKPRGYPLTDKEVSTEVASYVQNKNTGLSRMEWSCKAFPKMPKGECFK